MGRYFPPARQRRQSTSGSLRALCRCAIPRAASLRWFGTCTDISDQIAAEEKIRHLNSQLQQRLAELEAIMQVLPVGVAVSQDASCDLSPAMLL